MVAVATTNKSKILATEIFTELLISTVMYSYGVMSLTCCKHHLKSNSWSWYLIKTTIRDSFTISIVLR